MLNLLATGSWLRKRSIYHARTVYDKDTELFNTLKCPIENVLQKSSGWGSFFMNVLMSDNLASFKSWRIALSCGSCESVQLA